MKRELISSLLCAVTLVAITTPAGASPIQVLHVSQWELNEVQEIVDFVGATSLFDIFQVSLANFNAGTPKKLGEYDVIVFGINDCYEPSANDRVARTGELKSFVQSGGGVVWTHDTIELNGLGPDVEISAGVAEVSAEWIPSTEEDYFGVEIIQDHDVLHFPYEIGDFGDVLDVLFTHTIGGEVTTADKIIHFYGHEETANNFYLTANEYGAGRVIVNEIGHVVLPCPQAEERPVILPSLKESQLFINCLCWVCIDSPAGLLCIDLIVQVVELGLPAGIENSLVSKLENAIDSIQKGQTNAAVNKLEGFINEVEAQRGKKILETDANALIASAQYIIEVFEST